MEVGTGRHLAEIFKGVFVCFYQVLQFLFYSSNSQTIQF